MKKLYIVALAVLLGSCKPSFNYKIERKFDFENYYKLEGWYISDNQKIDGTLFVKKEGLERKNTLLNNPWISVDTIVDNDTINGENITNSYLNIKLNLRYRDLH